VKFPHRSLAALLVAATGSSGAQAQAEPRANDPVCDLDIAGVTLATSDDDMQKLWGGLGLVHVVESSAAAPGKPVTTTHRFGTKPGSPDRREWGPLVLTRSRNTLGQASVDGARQDTLRVTVRTGDTTAEHWRGWNFADLVAARVARFCNGADPRANCRFEGSMPRFIEVGPPADGRVPHCTYRLSLQGSQGQVYRSVVGEKEFDVAGRLGETVTRHVTLEPKSLRSPPMRVR